MKNFKKLSLVAGFATLMSFGAEAQITGPLNNVLSTNNYLNIGVGNNDAGLEITNGSVISLSLYNAFGSNTNWATTGIGFNLKRIPSIVNGVYTGSWKTKTEGFSNGGATMFGDVYGNLFFTTLPTTGGIGQTRTDQEIMSYRRMVLSKEGYLNIANRSGLFVGNIPTDVQLSVNGKIYATGVKIILPVNNAWPDYVFKQDYKLRTLTEVENFIAANNHLPDVPSELEVKTDGIELATMDAVLLRKVEELTLYMIQLQKDNLEMKAKLEALSK